jgi:hypothetical protein
MDYLAQPSHPIPLTRLMESPPLLPELSPEARTFAEALIRRYPDWRPHVQSYVPVSAQDSYPNCSFYALIPSPAPNGPSLTIHFAPGDALVALGDRAAEQPFAWAASENLDEAISGILDFIDQIVEAEQVAAWYRTRFLWKTWEYAQFRAAADVPADKSIIRVEAWPPPTRTASRVG